MNPRVTAVVLNWCNEADTAACVDSLLKSDYDALSILVVDNASPDGSGERVRARYPSIGYLQTGTNFGYAGGNNRGIAKALDGGADFVLVLNDDTIVDRACVTALVRAARETNAAVVAPQILYFDEPSIVWYGGGYLSRPRALGIHAGQDAPTPLDAERAAVTFVCGCSFLIRGSVARSIGGFNESFFAYAEDVELSLRLARDGHSMVYEPSAKIWHRQPRGVQPSAFQIRQRDRNRRRLARIHYGPVERAAFVAWFYPTRCAHALRYASRFDWERARAVMAGAFSSIATAGSSTSLLETQRRKEAE